MARPKLDNPVVLAAAVAVVGAGFGHLLGPFDLMTFLHAGSAVLHGHSPYVRATSGVFRSGHAFVYPLFVAWLFAPLALVPRGAAELLYAAGSVAAVVASCRLLGRQGWGAAALVLLSSTTITGLQMGTLNAFLLLGLALAWRWRSSHPLLAGIVLALSAAAKLFLLPVLLWPLLRRRYPTAAVACGGAAVLAASGVLSGTVAPSHYLHLLSHLQAREVASSWSLSSLLQGAGLPAAAASACSLSIALCALGALCAYRRRLADGQLLGGAVVCCLLLSPIVWSSYLLLLAVPVLLATSDDRLLALGAVCSWLIVTPDAAPAGRVALGVAATVAAAAAATVASRHRRHGLPRRTLRTLSSPPPAALAAAVVGAAGLLAAGLLAPAVESPVPALGATAAAGWLCTRGVKRAPRSASGM